MGIVQGERHIVLLASKITKQGVYKSRGYSNSENNSTSALLEK
jgi:hypothetical protein